MAKYFISADLEGVCGVTSLLQCYPKQDTSGYQAAVAQLALEITTVAEALLSADPAAEFVVNDAHSTMTNLTLAHLPAKVALLSGKPKLCAMMAGLDASFDAAILIGYHAKAGTERGVLNHTFHGKLLDVQVNGVSYGEGGINALYASLVHQVPVILASGDRAFCDEICALMPNLPTVETKAGLTTTAAQSRPVQELLNEYRKQSAILPQKQASWRANLLTIPGPYTLRVSFINTLACDVVATSPLYTRVDGLTVEMTAETFVDLYRGLQSTYTMLSYTAYME